MSVRRTEVSSVRFEINARPASVSMEALQAKADDLNKDIDIVKKNIADLGNVSPEHEGLKSYQKQLDDLNKKLKDVQTTMKDYTRGVKAADELLKAYDAGNIESLSMKAIKAGQNGLKKRIENIKPETASEEDLKAYRIITEVIRESQRVVDTFKTDARETIQIMEQGGTVAESTLKKTRDGVRDLMQSTKEGSKENREYAQQFEFLAEKMKQMETESARVSGQKMLGRAFRGDFATADTKTLNEVIAKLREYQSVIDDPNGKGARIYAAAEMQIKNLQASLDKLKMGFSNADEVMQRFNQHLGEPKIETATQQTEKLNAATSEYDENIKACLESIDYWEKALKESEDEVASLEAEYDNLVKLLNSGNPFKRLQGEMKGGWKRANNIQSWLEGEESDDNYGWRPAVNDAKNNIRSWKESLDFWKQQKAEALGLNEAEEQVAQTEEKLQQTRRMTIEQMQQGIKILEEEAMAQDRSTVDGQKKWEQLRSVIDQMNQELKESTGEWMKLADAEKLAEQAGENYYLADNKKGFIASPEEIQKATAALNRQRETLIKTIQAKKANKEATDAEEKELADLTKKLRDLKFEQDNVNMSQEKMRMLMKQPAQAVSLDELRAAIKRADGELRRMEGSLGKSSKEYKAFAEQVKQAKNTLKDMEGAAKASASAWEKAVSRLKTYVGLYMGFNIFWQKVTGTAGDLLTLSDKMGEVRKTTQMTADQVGRLSDALTKLDTRTSLTGLMEFSSLAGSIGLKTQEDVQGFTEAANMLSVSLPELGSEASRTLMKIADATGDLEKNGNNVRETLERVGSTVIALRANSAAAAGPITDFVSRVGAVGAQAGISIDQIAALGATVDALGGRVEMSATALSRMIPAIRNNTFEVAQAIGMTEKQLKSMSGIDQMVAVFKALRDSVKNFDMTTEEGMNAAADAVEGMLGRSVSMQDVMKQLNQQGARAGIVFGLLSQNVDTLEKQLKTAGEAYQQNTALMEEYNKMNDTAAAKWERLKNAMEEAFVSDSMQKGLGWMIDGLRKTIDLLVGSGGVSVALRTVITFLMLTKANLWGVFASMKGIEGGLQKIGIAIGFVNNETKKLQWGNIFTALAGAVLYAVHAFGSYRERLSDTQKEIGKWAQELVKSEQAVNDNFKAVDKANDSINEANKKVREAKAALEAAKKQMDGSKESADRLAKAEEDLKKAEDDVRKASDAHKSSIENINKIYGKYLGFMLSEISSANELANARELINAKLRETITLKRKEAALGRIEENYGEGRDKKYGELSQALGSSKRKKVKVGNKEVWTTDTEASTELLREITTMAQGEKLTAQQVEQVLSDAGLSIYETTSNGKKKVTDYGAYLRNLVMDYRKEYLDVQKKVKDTEMQFDVESSVDRKKTQKELKEQYQESEKTYVDLEGKYAAATGEARKKAAATLLKQADTLEGMIAAAPNYYDLSNDKEKEAYENFVKDAQARIDGIKDQRDALVKEAGSYYSSGNGGGGGGGKNPYGDYNDRVDPYEQWDANALVARRKEMLERVKALAGGADVQAVLSEDKRFMDEATRKGIKNMRDAIAWYNEERLKIQEELDARNLTPTGDWKNPKKGGRSKKKPKTPESEGAIAELDRYYSERKELIEEARANEQMTEAEYNRRLDALEQEHLTKRSELRQTFTSEDKQFIQQFRQWWASVKELDEVSWTAIEAEWIAAWERDRKYNNREAQKDLTAMQAIVVKQLKEIEAIIAKERPFNGITDNLQNNLTKMGLLFKDGVPENGKFMEENTKRLTFLLKEAENAYSLTFDQLAEDMRKNGLGSWADAIINSENANKEKRALIAQLHEVYDSVQDAIKKEASQVKKQVDIAWNDAILPNGKSMKATYEAAISALGVEQSSVSRANNLIGAGVASERVADRLAIKQLQLQLRMQEHYFNMVRKTGQQRVDDLLREAKLREDEGKTNEAERLRLGAKHAQMSLNLSLAKEETELAKQREEIIARTEESQNRLYTELKEWADLLASSMQSVFEASNAGNAEYYNELAKLNLTGKGGPGAGTYIVIENEGTEDARAHYEYLDERQALERQREIEQQNAQADAWKKVMDDLNQKMNDLITDQLNAMLQNQSIDANTTATILNTQALYEAANAFAGATGDGITRNAQGMAVDNSGNVVYPVQPEAQPKAEETPSWKPVWQMTSEEKEAAKENITEVMSHYRDASVQAETEKADLLSEIPNFTPSPLTITDEDIESLGEKINAMYQKEIDASKKKTAAVVEGAQKEKAAVNDANKTQLSSTQSTFAKMTQAANLYGIAYQAMTNDNLSASQKFEMIAIQAAGNAAMTALTVEGVKTEGETVVRTPSVFTKIMNELGPIAGPIAFGAFTALLGGLMGLAMSKLTKSKSQISQITGASVGAGRLATGMLTYAEGNVNELTDPSSLTPGRQYNVDGADGKTYRARYMGKDAKTHITNGPEFHLVGEKGREAIIDAHTTRLMQTDDTGIWQAIQTLYNGGRVSGFSTRRGRGVRAFAEGNINDFEGMDGGYDIATDSGGGGLGFDPAALQASLDRNSDVQEALLERLQHPLTVAGTGSNGVVAMYDKLKKEAQRQGVKYI